MSLFRERTSRLVSSRRPCVAARLRVPHLPLSHSGRRPHPTVDRSCCISEYIIYYICHPESRLAQTAARVRLFLSRLGRATVTLTQGTFANSSSNKSQLSRRSCCRTYLNPPFTIREIHRGLAQTQLRSQTILIFFW